MNMIWKLGRILVVFAVVGGLLSVAGLAAAQSSQSFDLGCWGTLTSGGGERLSGSYHLRDATGQVAIGETQSGQFTLRAGYVQDWSTLQAVGRQGASDALLPAETADDGAIFLPIIRNIVRSVRTCNY